MFHVKHLGDPDCCGSVQLNKRKASGLKGRPELQLCRLRGDILLTARVAAWVKCSTWNILRFLVTTSQRLFHLRAKTAAANVVWQSDPSTPIPRLSRLLQCHFPRPKGSLGGLRHARIAPKSENSQTRPALASIRNPVARFLRRVPRNDAPRRASQKAP